MNRIETNWFMFTSSLLFLVLMPHTLFSQDADWICKEAASLRTGNSILTCGIGVANSESTARLQALGEAKKEFEGICSASDDCKGHLTFAEPMRNDCVRTGDTFKCYRGVRFEISPKLSSESLIEKRNNALDQELRAAEAKLGELRKQQEKTRKIAALKSQIASGGKDSVSSDLGGYEGAKWGMSPQSVIELFPGGYHDQLQNGDSVYRVVRSLAGLSTALLNFSFSRDQKLNLVAIMFPEQGTEVDLKLGTFYEQSKKHASNTFQILKSKLNLKYGLSQRSYRADQVIWKTKAGDSVTLDISSFTAGRGTAAIIYQKIPQLSELSEGL